MKEYIEDFRFEGGVLQVRLSGKFPEAVLRQEKNLFQPLIDACSTYKCKPALVDARNLQVNFGTMALVRAGGEAASLARLGLRVAFLARPDSIDPFFDTVTANRGGNVGVFTDRILLVPGFRDNRTTRHAFSEETALQRSPA